jgi:hypothetical protein
MYLSKARSRLKRGDTVRLPDGSTGKVLNTPTHYDRADGYPFTGWRVQVQPDDGNSSSGIRLENVAQLTLIPNEEQG